MTPQSSIDSLKQQIRELENQQQTRDGSSNNSASVLDMILTQEEIKTLAKENGLWDEVETIGAIYYDPSVEILIRAAEKLILEKLDGKK